MALKLTAPIEEEFDLTETDEKFGSEGTKVRVRQATQAQHERRQKRLATFVNRFRGDEWETIQNFSLLELQRIECMLTVIESNIIGADGKQLFRPGMTEKEFEDAWGTLPPLVAREIHDKVLELNPTWRLQGE